MSRWRVGVVAVAALSALTFGQPTRAQQERAGEMLGTVDQFHGAFQTSIPIEVPQFHGIEPRLAISYNSASGNGFLGVGWSLSGFSTIERASIGFGAPRYDTADIFLLDGEKLVPCESGSLSPSCNNPDGGAGVYYSTEHESYLRIKYTELPFPVWTIWRKTGVKTTYTGVWYTTEWGVPFRTFRWGATLVEDTHGNQVHYQWACDSSGGTNRIDFDCQPWSVWYADANGTSPNSVTVMLYPTTAVRIDPVIFGIGQLYDPNIAHPSTPIGKTRFLLQSVDVTVGGLCDLAVYANATCPNRARTYRLQYGVTGTGRAALTTLQEYGKDAVLSAGGQATAGTTLPAATLSYSPAASAFLQEALGSTNWGVGTKQKWVDVNSDHEADYCRLNTYTGGMNVVCVMNPAGTAVFGSTPVTSGNITVSGYTETTDPDVSGHILHTGWDWTDVNGDGRADFCRPLHKAGLANTAHTGRIACVLSNGNGFGDQIVLDGDIDYGQAYGRAWVDFNGDGRSDYCRILGDEGSHGVLTASCLLSTCVSDPGNPGHCSSGGLFKASAISSSVDAGFDIGRGWADLNGDGRADYCRLVTGSPQAIDCTLSLGNAFGPSFVANADWGPDEMRDSISWTDFNGDGKSDFCRIVGGIQRNVNTQLACSLSTGAGWDVPGTILSGVIDSGFDNDFPNGGGRSDPIRRWVDFNGDGRSDFCRLVNVGGPSILNMVCRPSLGAAGFGADVPSPNLDGFSDYAYTADQWADIDGNGAMDFCRVLDSNKDGKNAIKNAQPECRRSQNLFPDLLAIMNNGYGAQVRVAYQSSTAWGKDPNSYPLPLFRTAVQVDTYPSGPSAPGVSTTKYAFGNGVYDPVERRFLGFRLGRTVPACVADSPTTTNACPVTDVFFKVDGATTPRPEVEWVYNSKTPPPLGNPPPVSAMLGATVHVYAEGALGVDGNAPYVTPEVARYDYQFQEGGAGCPSSWDKGTLCSAGRRKFTQMVPDIVSGVDLTNTLPTGSVPTTSGSPTAVWTSGYGNPSVTVEWGDYDVNGDERTTANYYYREVAKYLTLPAKADLWAGEESTPRGTPSRPLIGKTLSFYDGGNCQTEVGDGYMSQQRMLAGQTCAQGSPVALTQANQTSVARWDGTNLVTKSREYDHNRTNCSSVQCPGNVTAQIDELGHRTTFDYDTTYDLYVVRTTNALDQAPATDDVYDYRCGVKTIAYDLNNQATAVTLDNLCRPTRTDSPGRGVTRHSYVGFGDPALQYVETETATAVDTATPPNPTASVWERAFFDGLGRTYRTRRSGPAAGQEIVVDTTFNARGSVSTLSDPYYAGAATKLTTTWYDALNRPIRIQHPDGQFVKSIYGVGSGQSWTIALDEMSHASKRVEDAYGNVVEHSAAAGVYPSVVWDKATYTYDLLGQKLTATDPAGGAEIYVWDKLGRQLAVTTPDTGKRDFRYDAGGQLTWLGDNEDWDNGQSVYYQPLGGGVVTADFRQVIEYAYDVLGRRVTKLMVPNAPRCATPKYPTTRTWTYDEARTGSYNGNTSYVFSNKGRLTTTADPLGSETLDYDAAGRVIRRTRTIEGSTYVFESGFDVAGRLLWTKYPDGTSVGDSAAPRTYDAAGRPAGIPSFVSNAQYDAAGRPISFVNLSNPTTVTTRTYSPDRGWLTRLQTLKTGTTTILQDETYQYFADGQLSSVTTPFPNEGWTLTYDGKHQLTTATNATDPAQSQSFTYAPNQNMASNSRIGTYTYGTGMPSGPMHDVQCVGGNTYADIGYAGTHAVRAAGSGSYRYYDINGNAAWGNSPAVGGFRAEYDADGTMTSLLVAGYDTTYAYDADGNRIKEWYVAGGASPYPRYYLGDDYELTAGIATKYLRLGPMLVAKMVGTTKNWLHSGRDGTLQVVSNQLGSSIRRRWFRPYGEEVYISGTHLESHSFTGERRDASGLMYLHARYYLPELGQFMAADTMTPTTAPIGLNRYAYADNDPINKTDPTGHAAWLAPVLVKLVATAFVSFAVSDGHAIFAATGTGFSAPPDATEVYTGPEAAQMPKLQVGPIGSAADAGGTIVDGMLVGNYEPNPERGALIGLQRAPKGGGWLSQRFLHFDNRAPVGPYLHSDVLKIHTPIPEGVYRLATVRNLERLGKGFMAVGVAADIISINSAKPEEKDRVIMQTVYRRVGSSVGMAFGSIVAGPAGAVGGAVIGDLLGGRMADLYSSDGYRPSLPAGPVTSPKPW